METMDAPVMTDNDVDGHFARLYEDAYPSVARLISKMGGSFDDAREIFHDALIAWYEMERAGKIPGDVSSIAYVMGIARHLYLRRIKARQSDTFDDTLNLVDEDQPTADEKRLLKLIQQSGTACLDLLVAFYYDRLNAERLAVTFGFGSARSATVQKHKCLEKIRNVVKEKSLRYEDFLE